MYEIPNYIRNALNLPETNKIGLEVVKIHKNEYGDATDVYFGGVCINLRLLTDWVEKKLNTGVSFVSRPKFKFSFINSEANGSAVYSAMNKEYIIALNIFSHAEMKKKFFNQIYDLFYIKNEISNSYPESTVSKTIIPNEDLIYKNLGNEETELYLFNLTMFFITDEQFAEKYKLKFIDIRYESIENFISTISANEKQILQQAMISTVEFVSKLITEQNFIHEYMHHLQTTHYGIDTTKISKKDQLRDFLIRIVAMGRSEFVSKLYDVVRINNSDESKLYIVMKKYNPTFIIVRACIENIFSYKLLKWYDTNKFIGRVYDAIDTFRAYIDTRRQEELEAYNIQHVKHEQRLFELEKGSSTVTNPLDMGTRLDFWRTCFPEGTPDSEVEDFINAKHI